MFALRHLAAQVHPRFGALRRRRDRRLNAIRPSKANAAWYYGTLNHEVVIRLRTLGTEVAHELQNHWPPPPAADASSFSTSTEAAKREAGDAKAPPKPKKSNPHEVTAAVDRARAKFPPHVARGVAVHISTKLVKKNLDTVDDKLSASIKQSLPGVDIRNMLMQHGPILDAMGDALEANVDLITSMPVEYFDGIEDVISEAWDEGRSWTSMVGDIQERGDVTQSRAELIARDQTLRLNSQFNQVRQQSIGVSRYEWQTAGDDRVSEAHAELEGTIHDWDDPPTDADGNTGHPGDNRPNCRCVASPLLDLDEPEGDEPDDEGDEDEIDAEEE